jgi:hypothetical protein
MFESAWTLVWHLSDRSDERIILTILDSGVANKLVEFLKNEDSQLLTPVVHCLQNVVAGVVLLSNFEHTSDMKSTTKNALPSWMNTKASQRLSSSKNIRMKRSARRPSSSFSADENVDDECLAPATTDTGIFSFGVSRQLFPSNLKPNFDFFRGPNVRGNASNVFSEI